MVLGLNEIENNKQRYIELLRKISRPSDVEQLINYLDNNGFFTSPASTKFHASYEGGLCEHSLNVYDSLVQLIESKYKDIPFPVFDNDSIIITALCHDLDKVNLYEKTAINTKVYSTNGSKYDEVGNYDWVTTIGYKTTENSKRFLFGTHGQNSERITSAYIPLTDEESCAIVNHHSVYDNPKLDITSIYNKYTLACLLLVSDILATYVDEKIL